MIVYGGALEVPNVVIDYEKCDNCLNCFRTCPMQVLKVENKRVVQSNEICFACRNCEAACPQDAIKVLGRYREIKGTRKSGIGYNKFVAFPVFEGLAPDKERLFVSRNKT
jgi:NAD-dependent dihydropyrimidine dehydrogenase PreA subunit